VVFEFDLYAVWLPLVDYREKSVAGILLSYWVYIVYMVATAFEE
jgi:hypothetical protein